MEILPWTFCILAVSRYRIKQRKVRLEQDKNGRKFKTFRYLIVDESRLHVVQPCIVDQAVYCFDYQGNPIFTYTDDKLVFPQGVAIDIHGNIYVCDSKSCCIHVISSSGNGLGIIVGHTELEWPIAIACKPDGTEFVVTHGRSKNQQLSIYQLTYMRE